MEIIVAVKEHKAHAAMIIAYLKEPVGAMKSAAKAYTSQGSNRSKGEYKGQHQRQRLTGETQKGKMVSASIAGVQVM